MKVTVPAGFVIEYEDEKHKYRLNGDPVVSVTTALGVLDKSGPLMWWAWKMGIGDAFDWAHKFSKFDDLEAYLKANKLHPNAKRDKAADRGVGAHYALEQLATTGRFDLSKVEPEDQGYASGVMDWWLGAEPTECVVEQMVGSRKHGFAGRYDLDCVIDGARTLVDLKTSKGIYESHMLQLEMYGIAAAESGYGKFENKLVLRAAPDGTFEEARSYATVGQALAVLGAYKAMQQLKKSKPKKSRKAAA